MGVAVLSGQPRLHKLWRAECLRYLQQEHGYGPGWVEVHGMVGAIRASCLMMKVLLGGVALCRLKRLPGGGEADPGQTWHQPAAKWKSDEESFSDQGVHPN